jgi:hypothetical protein
MGERPTTDKPLFSIKDLLYFATIIGGFFISNSVTVNSMKMEIHDAVLAINYNKKEAEYKLATVFTTLSDQDKKITLLMSRMPIAGIKPKEIKIESE